MSLIRCRLIASDGELLPPLPLRSCELDQTIFSHTSLATFMNPTTLPSLTDLSMFSVSPSLSPAAFNELAPRLLRLKIRHYDAEHILGRLGHCTALEEVQAPLSCINSRVLAALKSTKLNTLRLILDSTIREEDHGMRSLCDELKSSGRGTVRRIIMLTVLRKVSEGTAAFKILQEECTRLEIELSNEKLDDNWCSGG